MNELHLFDLDGTLWNTNSKIWIIDKKYPNTPLIKLDGVEFQPIFFGVYMDQEINIEYNGETYYISEELLKKLQKIKPIIPKERLGVSFKEFKDVENYDKIDFLINNIKHLFGNEHTIGFLTGRHSQKLHGKYLNELRLLLKKYNLNVHYVYFVGDKFNYDITDKISKGKQKVITEHLIGFKIEKNSFINKKVDQFDIIYFYDDEPKNIWEALDINNYLKDILKNTEPNLKQHIKLLINSKDLILNTNLVTGNSINIYIKDSLKISVIDDFENIKKFKEF